MWAGYITTWQLLFAEFAKCPTASKRQISLFLCFYYIFFQWDWYGEGCMCELLFLKDSCSGALCIIKSKIRSFPHCMGSLRLGYAHRVSQSLSQFSVGSLCTGMSLVHFVPNQYRHWEQPASSPSGVFSLKVQASLGIWYSKKSTTKVGYIFYL